MLEAARRMAYNDTVATKKVAIGLGSPFVLAALAATVDSFAAIFTPMCAYFWHSGAGEPQGSQVKAPLVRLSSYPAFWVPPVRKLVAPLLNVLGAIHD